MSYEESDEPNKRKIEKINDYKERMAIKQKRLAQINKRLVKNMKKKDAEKTNVRNFLDRSGNISN
jgi:hypothetical protein